MSAQKDEPELGIDYGDDLQPMTEAEFERLQQDIKRRRGRPKRLGRRREITAAEAPAFLADHYMAGYLHWVVKLSGESSISAAAPGKAGK